MLEEEVYKLNQETEQLLNKIDEEYEIQEVEKGYIKCPVCNGAMIEELDLYLSDPPKIKLRCTICQKYLWK